MLELPPLSLYVHIPWCVRKCPYCDFNSHEFAGSIDQDAYIDALCRDLDRELERCIARPLLSIFIGGGTPSLFDAGAYRRLLSHIGQRLELGDCIEITLEANPGTAEAGRFAAYRDAGINRLSLGIQSFDDLRLQGLGRIHDGEQARRAIVMAREAGFDNLNLDLMHGLPGQKTEHALEDLRTALAFGPSHLSWYQLTIEPNTVFHARPPRLPADSQIEEVQERGQRLLGDAGFQQYEVSAYSRPAHAALHNRNYWRFGDYLGIGAGAHGKLSFPGENRILRTRKVKQPAHYLAAQDSYDAEVVEVGEAERPLEFLMNALRLKKGFSRAQFETVTGVPFSTIAKRVEYLTRQGLMETVERHDDRYYAATATGYLVLNTVLEEFL